VGRDLSNADAMSKIPLQSGTCRGEVAGAQLDQMPCGGCEDDDLDFTDFKGYPCGQQESQCPKPGSYVDLTKRHALETHLLGIFRTCMTVEKITNKRISALKLVVKW
jgi:hypothetical protein